MRGSSFLLSFLPSFRPSFLPSSPDLICQLLIAVGLRTSTASSRTQWASPDLNCQLSNAVGLAGPPPPALERSGTSTASSPTQWASGPPLPALDRSGPLPDLNRRESERCGRRRTSTGPQRPETTARNKA